VRDRVEEGRDLHPKDQCHIKDEPKECQFCSADIGGCRDQSIGSPLGGPDDHESQNREGGGEVNETIFIS
jgi:hypothetical protein